VRSNPNQAGLSNILHLFKLKYSEGRINTFVEDKEDELLDINLSPTISADWDAKVKTIFFSDDLENKIIDDKSAGEAGEDAPVSLDDCIKLFSQQEVLEGDDAWFCPQCKKHQRTLKQMNVWKLPRILVIHLKRFASKKPSTGREEFLMKYGIVFRAKLTTIVNFPLRGLNLSKFVESAASQNCIYDLFAVSNHYGGTHAGHYTAYCLREVDGNSGWFKFDDSRVSQIEEAEVQSSSAYVLFYKLRE